MSSSLVALAAGTSVVPLTWMVTVTSGPGTVAPLVGEVMVTCGCCWDSAVEASANGRTNPNTARMRNIGPLNSKRWIDHTSVGPPRIEAYALESGRPRSHARTGGYG